MKPRTVIVLVEAETTLPLKDVKAIASTLLSQSGEIAVKQVRVQVAQPPQEPS